MDQVGVCVDQHLVVHGQALQLDHAVIDALLCCQSHPGDGLPDIEHPGVDPVLSALQLGEVQHILDQTARRPDSSDTSCR